MRFFLDEQYSDIIAVLARRLGVDIISSHECGRDGFDDGRQLALAAQEDRCVVTENWDDFVAQTFTALEQGLPHAGVVLVPRSLPGEDYAAIARALAHFDREHPDGLAPYTVLWLRPAPP